MSKDTYIRLLRGAFKGSRNVAISLYYVKIMNVVLGQARPRAPRSPEQQNPTSWSCWWHSYLREQVLLLLPTWTFWRVCAKVLGENGLRNGRTTGRCITITRPVTWLWQFSSFWQKQHSDCATPALFPRPRTKWLLALPYAESGPSRTSFLSGGRY
jgi:hypothetical protein